MQQQSKQSGASPAAGQSPEERSGVGEQPADAPQPEARVGDGGRTLISGARTTALGILASRVLGLLRDMATAALLGLAGGGVMDAFALAWRLPNLARRLFGEGALAAAYLPVLSARLETDRKCAWQLASVVLTLLAVLLAVLVLAGEGLLAVVWWLWGGTQKVDVLVSLAAVMLPYMVLVCVAAQLTATLHALGRFGVPAFSSVVLNLVWLGAAVLVAPQCSSDPAARAHVLAAAILLAGLLQVGVHLPALRREGFRFHFHWQATRPALGRIARSMLPMMAGLAAIQLNTLADSLIAWGLAAAPDGPPHIGWLPGRPDYPLRQGAAAAVYFGERFYQFPLGVVGVAVAASVFPLLSRHAARGDRRRLAADLSLGLRLVTSLGVPAGVGLMLLARPLVHLLLEHGRFSAAETDRAARMVGCYAAGVAAYCALPVLVRGFYALGRHATPARVAGAMVGLNLSLNLTLIWTPLNEAGLAVATAICAAVHVFVLLAILARWGVSLEWLRLGLTLLRTLPATALMAAAVWWLSILAAETGNLWWDIGRELLLPIIAALVVYAAVYRLLGGRELAMLLAGRFARHDQWEESV